MDLFMLMFKEGAGKYDFQKIEEDKETAYF